MPSSSVLHYLLVLSNACLFNQWCYPTMSSLPSPSTFVFDFFQHLSFFPNEPAFHIRCPKYWSFSFGISPSNEYLEFISFSIRWFDLAVQGILKSLLQHHKLKALIFQCSAFFMVQISHLCVTTGKTIALTIWTFVNGKVMSLLFNMLLRFVIPFPPWSKRFFNFMATVTACSDFGAQEN